MATDDRTPADPLGRYRAKRDFDATSEPVGSAAPAPSGHRFVVQRHRARSLHYDLRLEAGGVLMSWAVPKGPTLDADRRRMAVRVEDHPLEYYDFEGAIPAGQYGGGEVIVWDWGTWTLTAGDDPIAAAEAGDLHFDLHGEKLRGHFALVRRGASRGREQWLLVHKHDESAVAGWEPEDHPRSVKTGRTSDEVRAAPSGPISVGDAVSDGVGLAQDARSSLAVPFGTGASARRSHTLLARHSSDPHVTYRDGPSATQSPSAVWAAPTPDELAALDALGSKGTWQLGQHSLRLTNLDKVLFPPSGAHEAVSKRELIRHHACLAPAMLPYLHDRPVNLHRYPDGVEAAGFWQKAVPGHAPDWLTRWRNPGADPGETQEYLVLDSPAALAWAANHGAVELHPWTSPGRDPSHPSWAMFDIDPGASSSFDDVVLLARLHRTALEHVGVRGMPKVTGRRGLQIWVPVATGTSFDETRGWVERLSRLVAETVPDLVSWEWEIAKRGGRIRLDYTQNAINKTLVAPFSARPAAGAPVSVPIAWDELDDPELRPDRWTVATIGEHLAGAGDPLAPLIGLQQRLPAL